MRVRLKEEPREWQKFTAVTAVLIGAIGYYLRQKRVLSGHVTLALWLTLGAVILVCLIRPRWFRSFYRSGMVASAYMGTIVGGLMMTLLFLFVLTPLGWFFRCMGKDPLRLKRNTQKNSYWRNARDKVDLDRMF